jgi:hypothetical protein
MTVLERSDKDPRAAIVETRHREFARGCLRLVGGPKPPVRGEPEAATRSELTDGLLGVGTRYKAEFTPGLADAGESVPCTPATRGPYTRATRGLP